MKEETLYSIFQETQFIIDVCEYHYESSCLNGENKVNCSERVTSIISIAAKTGAKAITQFSGRTIDDAVGLVMKDANKLNHLFPAKHNLGGLVNQLGGQENTIRAVLNAANGKLPASGVFNNIPVSVGGQTGIITMPTGI